MNNTTQISIKLILAGLFLGCLASMPYGYYQLVRTSGTVGFAALAWADSNKPNKSLTIVGLLLLYLSISFSKLPLTAPYGILLMLSGPFYLLAPYLLKDNNLHTKKCLSPLRFSFAKSAKKPISFPKVYYLESLSTKRTQQSHAKTQKH